MSRALYVVDTQTAAVALVATTAKTVVSATGGADYGLQLCKYRISFDGVTASAVPVFCEIVVITGATGTATPQTPIQTQGKVMAATNMVGNVNYSAEPTVTAVVDSFDLTPNSGTLVYDWQYGDEPDTGFTSGFGLRCTAPAAVNFRGGVFVSRV